MFTTQEIGSLPKPTWLLKSNRRISISSDDLKEVKYWGCKLDIKNYEELVKLLKEADSLRKRKKVRFWALTYAIKFLESTGLDRVYTGEMLRTEMYEHPASRIDGFRLLGRIQSFDNKYYRVAMINDKLMRKEPIYIHEFKLAKKVAKKELKVPIIGPYTMADWTLDEYYLRKKLITSKSIKEAKQKARRELVLELAKKVFKPEIRDLVESGAIWIQIDEPAVTTHPQDGDMRLFVESFNMLTKGLSVKFSLHNCYSRYDILSKYVPELKNCYQLALEFANRDSLNLGTEDEQRPGYDDLKLFVQNGYTGNFGVGVLNVLDFMGYPTKNVALVNSTLIESPQLIRDRLNYAAKIVGDATKIYASPDCGLRTRRDWRIIMRKLVNMVKAAKQLP